MPRRQNLRAQYLPEESIEATNQETTLAPEQKDTATPQSSIVPQKSTKPQVSELEKLSFYLEPKQVNKVYDLVEDYRKRTGIRVNRNDIIRRIIDIAEIDNILP